MSARFEDRRFHWEERAARAFFTSHGYVVVAGVLDDAQRRAIQGAWDEVVTEAATLCGIGRERFVERFPQNRDLWRKSKGFHDLLFASRQATIAAHFLGVSGVRLFHDHAICKPARASGTIPWHQDSAYWPLDRAGLSLWTPVEDVPCEGGCLHVLDGSHLDGPAEPQDFLARGGARREDDPRYVKLPARKGDTVVLHGLTWHGSHPNDGRSDRLAYLTLWVPATARFVPEHAGWHPTAAHIQVGSGERLDGEWFPLFGTAAEVDEGEHVRFPPAARDGGPSMFTASQDVAAQIAWLLGAPPASLDALLAGEGAARVVRTATAAGLVSGDGVARLREVLHDLLLQDRVRRTSAARDVYLRGITRWWSLVGAQIEGARRAA